MMIPEDIQKEWDAHLKEWRITMGMPKFLDIAAYKMLELSSTFSGYALGMALGDHPPVGLPYLFSDFIKAYMFAKFVLDDYLWDEGRKELFLDWLRRELDESKESLQKITDRRISSFRDQ